MLNLVTALLGAAEQVFGYMNTKESQKYIDKCLELKSEIKKEWALWPNWDDSKIEKLWADLKDIEEALTAQIAIHNAKS